MTHKPYSGVEYHKTTTTMNQTKIQAFKYEQFLISTSIVGSLVITKRDAARGSWMWLQTV